jgi:hypothetical protein
MDLSIAHDGNHIADIRSTQTGISDLIPYGAEFRAWQTTLISAISNKVETLELAGGYTVYDPSWAQAELGKNALNGISGFLTNWAEITNPPKP